MVDGITAKQQTKVRSYQDLRFWQQGMSLAEACSGLTRRFPEDELFGMTWQIRADANFRLPFCRSAHLPICPPADLPICPPADLPTCRPADLPICRPPNLL